MKLKVLMSFRPRLDHFRELAFLLGSSETLPEHLSSCENLCANPRLKLEGASIAFDIYTVGRLLIFPPCYALQMDFWGPSFRVDEKSEKFLLIRYCRVESGFPMRVSDSSMGGDADQVAKIEEENRALCDALIAAEGRLRP